MLSEGKAWELMRDLRWPDGVQCPYCNSRKIYRRTRNFRFRCKECARRFSVTTRTLLHQSKVPLRFWVEAFRLWCKSKQGISAKELQRRLGLAYGTCREMAWKASWIIERFPDLRNFLESERARQRIPRPRGESTQLRKVSFFPVDLETVLRNALRMRPMKEDLNRQYQRFERTQSRTGRE